MDKEKALKDAKQVYEKNLANIEAAQKICNKIDSLLPKGWHSVFRGGYLEFCPVNQHKSSPAEFRMVCDLVEKATGKKLGRRANGDKERVQLYASCYSDFGNGAWLTLWIESDADDSCKVTFKRTWGMKAIVDERCLGLSNLRRQ